MNINFLQFYYKLTNNNLYIDNKEKQPPDNVFPICFKNSINICYINSLIHVLRQIQIVENHQPINNEFAKSLSHLLDEINKDFKNAPTKKYSTYFLQDFKSSIKNAAYSYLEGRLGLHPYIAITDRGGIMLQILCGLVVPSLSIKSIVKYKSLSGDIRQYNYINLLSDSTYESKYLLNSQSVSYLKNHVTTCGGCKIPTDELFNINFEHDIDFPYDKSNKPGLGLATNYLTLQYFSSLTNTHPISDPEFFKSTYKELIDNKIISISNNLITRDISFRLIEDGDPTDLNYKIYIFEKDDKKILTVRKRISDMSYFICNSCKMIFPYKVDSYTLSFVDDFIIFNKYRNIHHNRDITSNLTFNSGKVVYEPVAFTCAFTKDLRLQRGHIICITKEKNNKFYLYEDERIPILVNPNDFNKFENEIIIIYKLISNQNN